MLEWQCSLLQAAGLRSEKSDAYNAYSYRCTKTRRLVLHHAISFDETKVMFWIYFSVEIRTIY